MFVYPVFRCFVYSVPGPRVSACGGDDDGAQLGPITEAGQIESDISSRSLARAPNEGTAHMKVRNHGEGLILIEDTIKALR